MVTWTEAGADPSSPPAPRTYILCATPRSGSTMLCGMLAESGAGWPASYFHQRSLQKRFAALGLAPDAPAAAFIAAVRRAGSAGTAICGIRLMGENLGDMLAMLPGRPGASDRARIEAAFGPVRFLHLSRQDKLAQAVSRERAEHSGLWHRTAEGADLERKAGTGPPAYDRVRLAARLAELEAQDAAWRTWFDREGIAPVPITYEALAADPQGTLRRVLGALDLDPARADGVAPATARLADPETATWLARFRAETGAAG